MIPWFRGKQNEPLSAESVTGAKPDDDTDDLSLVEKQIISFLDQTAHFKEKLQLLESEIKRKDLSHLICLINKDIDNILSTIGSLPQASDETTDSRYVLKEELAGNKPIETSLSHSLANIEEEETVSLVYPPDSLIEVKEYGKQWKKKILFVEDNEDLRTFYRLALSSSYDITDAENGIEALKVAMDENPDLIVSDLMMPLMDGIDLCKAIKSDVNTNHIPFIILTAKDAVASRLEGTQSGADVYLSKPTSAELLQATIENIFSQRQKIKDYFSKNHYSEALTLVHSIKEQEFISKVMQIIEDNLMNERFEVDIVCKNLNLSRTKLYQKVKSLTGKPIVEFVRSYRLKRAKEIMTHEDVSLSEVIFRVGIQTSSYFTKAFKKEFGQTPSQFLDEIRSKKKL